MEVVGLVVDLVAGTVEVVDTVDVSLVVGAGVVEVVEVVDVVLVEKVLGGVVLLLGSLQPTELPTPSSDVSPPHGTDKSMSSSRDCTESHKVISRAYLAAYTHRTQTDLEKFVTGSFVLRYDDVHTPTIDVARSVKFPTPHERVAA